MLKVNEIFGPTVQGEGKSAGRPVAFLRLAMCNLHCIWCDTPHTWNWTDTKFAHLDKYVKEDEVHEMSCDEVFVRLIRTRMQSLVISGGEPFLQQRQLLPLVQLLHTHSWWVEVETNGTVLPRADFISSVSQVNCSPKLANSLDTSKLRIRPATLRALSAIDKVNFKFVIETSTDLKEVFELIEEYKFREVRLMPECRTREEMRDKEEWLRAICKEHNFIYCTRLSIEMSGTKRGV